MCDGLFRRSRERSSPTTTNAPRKARRSGQTEFSALPSAGARGHGLGGEAEPGPWRVLSLSGSPWPCSHKREVVRMLPMRLDDLTPVAGVRHRSVQVNGIEMHVAEAGDGPPLLLLHGRPHPRGSDRKP